MMLMLSESMIKHYIVSLEIQKTKAILEDSVGLS